MPDDSYLKVSDLATIKAEIVASLTGDGSRIQFGTVRALKATEGHISYVTTQIDGSPAGDTLDVPSIYPGVLYAGMRVAVLWDPPHQCYIIGVVDTAALPIGRISQQCSSGGYYLPPGETTVAFCCQEYMAGTMTSTLTATDAYLTVPLDGMYLVTATVTYTAFDTTPPGSPYTVTGRLDVYAADDTFLHTAAAADGAWPYASLVLTATTPIPAGGHIRVVVTHDDPNAMVAAESSHLDSYLITPLLLDITACSKGGSG